ncbi:hypothetical protein NE236_10540 [Actinoallomurus purpureus]|uniref:hypothetical protein n=1 Tax=Actinoallomurus purpureus TaxID=478114 RepID=UPI002092D049|nr:hypothetical protein [Actinoallomurus purpureus]MCO6005419.1 hypothetical protein [Actinoallomurus purpureus]
MFRTLAALATSSAALMASALPSAASTTQPTVIVGFASSVTTVAYQQPVTFTGELVEGRAKTPVPNEPVQIELASIGHVYVPVAVGTTGSDGRFAVTTMLPSGGLVMAVFGGDTDLASSRTNEMVLYAKHPPSRLVLDPVPASVPAGTPATFSGTLQVQVDGAWQPFEGAPLTLTMEPGTSSQSDVDYRTTSGADGRFSLTEPVSETSDWSIDVSLDGTYGAEWFPDNASARYGWIYGVSRTRVGFTLPSRDEAHHAYDGGMHATGTVERWNGGSWVGLPYGWVDFYYLPKGSKTWHKDNGAQTGADGHFSSPVGVHLGTADWQVRVRPAADTLTSTSTGTVTSTVTDHTHFASAGIYRRSSGSTISGRVTDWYSGQPSFSSLRGLKVHLYYRARGSKTWHAYRTVTVGKSGFFQFSVAKSHGYYFKVVFPTQGAYQTSTSRTL